MNPKQLRYEDSDKLEKNQSFLEHKVRPHETDFRNLNKLCSIIVVTFANIKLMFAKNALNSLNNNHWIM